MIRINLFKRVVEMLDRLENEIEMLERHLEVLNAVVVGEPVGISKLSEVTGHSNEQSPLLAPNIRAGGLDQTITVRRNYEREDFRVCSELRAPSRPVSQEAK